MGIRRKSEGKQPCPRANISSLRTLPDFISYSLAFLHLLHWNPPFPCSPSAKCSSTGAPTFAIWAQRLGVSRGRHAPATLCSFVCSKTFLASSSNEKAFCPSLPPLFFSSISIHTGKSQWEKPKLKQCKLLQGLPDKIVDLANITISNGK